MVRVFFFLLGLMIFLQANHWAAHTSTPDLVVLSWAMAGLFISTNSIMLGRLSRHG